MAATANTIPSDPPPTDPVRWVRAHQARRQTRWMAVPAGILALVLLAMAIPRFVGEMIVWPARIRIADIQASLDVAQPDDLAADIALVEAGGSWTGDGRLIADGGLMLMRQAAMTDDPAERLALLHRAVAMTQEGLRRAPAHPVAWTRLSALRVSLGDPQGATQALRLSLLAGLTVPQITASRLAQGLALLPYMDQETRALLARQVRLLVTTQPERLEALKTNAAAIDFITQAITAPLASQQEGAARK